jgi:hypothetical protein
MSIIVISEYSLGKILILGIGDKIFLLSEVLKGFPLCLVYKTNIFNILYRVPIMKEALIVEIHSVI